MSILDDLADDISVKLRDGVKHQPHTIEAVAVIEKAIKDQIRKGAFVTEQQLQDSFRELIITGKTTLIFKGKEDE